MSNHTPLEVFDETDLFCAECNKALHPDRAVWVGFNNATGRWVSPEEITGIDDGMQPLGVKCADNLNIPKAWRT